MHAVLVLGDQLWANSPLLHANSPSETTVILIEALSESKVVWVHKARTALFLSAMRHFAQQLRADGFKVIYSKLADTGEVSLPDRVVQLCQSHGISHLNLLEPGEWRLEQDILNATKQAGVGLRIVEDSHFMCSRAAFAKWASKYKQLRMEYFYREMRQQHQVLMDGKDPEGGQWNFDADNRSAFPKSGPGEITPHCGFEPDDITREVIGEVERLLPDNPGQLNSFAWPVTPVQARQAMAHFIEHRLPKFGPYQDAMWTDTPFGWHSLLAAAINLHLLDPREVISAAEQAYKQGKVDLPSAEGFIRQILGWREFMRGVYWLDMPAMRQANHLKAEHPLPAWFWTGKTHMNCMKESIGQTLEHAYAHHIQRLMVIGNFALLAGLSPQQVEDWFLAVYVDAVEWVELPNVAGMALFANGGRFTSKPYIASGAYIKRMSNYCQGCKYRSDQKTGDTACPFTTLYWDFIARHEPMLVGNPRTALMAKNWQKQDDQAQAAIRQTAETMLRNLDTL